MGPNCAAPFARASRTGHSEMAECPTCGAHHRPVMLVTSGRGSEESRDSCLYYADCCLHYTTGDRLRATDNSFKARTIWGGVSFVLK